MILVLFSDYIRVIKRLFKPRPRVFGICFLPSNLFVDDRGHAAPRGAHVLRVVGLLVSPPRPALRRGHVPVVVDAISCESKNQLIIYHLKCPRVGTFPTMLKFQCYK